MMEKTNGSMYTYTLQYYLALRENKIIDTCYRWLHTENIMSSDTHQSERVPFYLHQVASTDKKQNSGSQASSMVCVMGVGMKSYYLMNMGLELGVI